MVRCINLIILHLILFWVFHIQGNTLSNTHSLPHSSLLQFPQSTYSVISCVLNQWKSGLTSLSIAQGHVRIQQVECGARYVLNFYSMVPSNVKTLNVVCILVYPTTEKSHGIAQRSQQWASHITVINTWTYTVIETVT